MTHIASVKRDYGVATISRLLRLQVSFAEYSPCYRALLHKSIFVLFNVCFILILFINFRQEREREREREKERERERERE